MGGKVLMLPSDKIRRAEKRAEKRARAEERETLLISLVEDNLLTISEAASRLGESESAFKARLKRHNKSA